MVWLLVHHGAPGVASGALLGLVWLVEHHGEGSKCSLHQTVVRREWCTHYLHYSKPVEGGGGAVVQVVLLLAEV